MAISDESFDWACQKLHLASGALATLAPPALGAGPKGMLIGAGLITLWAAVKEFYYDQRFEDAEERGSNLRDFMYYEVGVALALILWVVFHHYGF